MCLTHTSCSDCLPISVDYLSLIREVWGNFEPSNSCFDGFEKRILPFIHEDSITYLRYFSLIVEVIKVFYKYFVSIISYSRICIYGASGWANVAE